MYSKLHVLGRVETIKLKKIGRQISAVLSAMVLFCSTQLSAAAVPVAPATRAPKNLNLNSTTPVAPQHTGSAAAQPGGTTGPHHSGAQEGRHTGFHQVVIQVGQTSRTVSLQSSLTAAERIAVSQVLHGGQQTLILGSQGNAVGGSFTLTPAMSRNLGSLIIPAGVTVIDNAARGPLSLAGNLIDAGTLVAVSTNPSTTVASISAANIITRPGGVLTTVIPAGLLLAVPASVANLSLQLTATGNLINQGTITSAGNLVASAGGSIINGLRSGQAAPAPLMQAVNNISLTSGTGNFVNSGLVAATNGNINFAAPSLQNMTIQNNGGTIEALAGNINVRDASFNGQANLTINGGNLLSRQLNLYSGAGGVNLTADQVSGTVNVAAEETHMAVAGGSFNLGSIDVAGDPVFYNQSGSINLTGDITTDGAALAVVASGNITSSGTLKIDTTQTNGNGAPVILLAGATFAGCSGAGCPGPILPPNPSSDTLTISGFGNSGNINLSSGTLITTAGKGTDASGAAVTIAAPGTVTVPRTMSILTGGTGTGNNGDVTVIAGAASGTSVTLGTVNTKGGSGTGGTISISTAIPSGNGVISNGALTSGGFSPGATVNSSILVFHLTAAVDAQLVAGGSINIGNSSFSGSIDAQGNATLSAGNSIFVNNPGSAGGIKVQGNANLTAGSTVDVGGTPASPGISAQGLAAITAGSTINIGITSANTGAISAQTVTLSAPTMTAWGPITTTTGDITFTTTGSSLTVNTRDGAKFTSGGNINFNGSSLQTLQVASPTGVDGTLIGNNVSFGGANTSSITVNIREIDAPITFNGGSNLNSISVGVYTGTLNVPTTLSVPGDLSFSGNIVTANNVNYSAGNNLHIGLPGVAAGISTSGNVVLSAGNNIDVGGTSTVPGIAAQGTVSLTAGNAINVGQTSASTGNINGRSVTLTAPTMTTWGPITSTGGDITFTTTGPNLIVNVFGGSKYTSSANLNFNGASLVNLQVLSPTGQDGTFTANNIVFGGPNTFGTDVFVRQLSGPITLNGGGNLTVVSLGTLVGTLTVPANISVSSTTVGGGSVFLAAPSGITVGDISADGGGAGNSGGSINLISRGPIVSGFLSAQGLNGADGGFINVNTNSTFQAKTAQVDALGKHSSLDVSSTQHNAGSIYVTTVPEDIDKDPAPLFEVGSIVTNGTLSNVLAEAGNNGGYIQLHAGSVGIAAGLGVDARGTPPGLNGRVVFLNAFGKRIRAELEPAPPKNSTTSKRSLGAHSTAGTLAKIATDVTGNPTSDDPFDEPDMGGDDSNSEIAAITGGSILGSELGYEKVLTQELQMDQPAKVTHHFRLHHGNIFFSLHQDLDVETQEGALHVKKGSLVFVMKNKDGVAIYDLHDAQKGGVKVDIGGQQIVLSPGKEVVITKEDFEKFEAVNPGKQIAYRNVVLFEDEHKTKVFKADFSILSAITEVKPLSKLIDSKKPIARKLYHQLVKNAVILADVNPDSTAFGKAED